LPVTICDSSVLAIQNALRDVVERLGGIRILRGVGAKNRQRVVVFQIVEMLIAGIDGGQILSGHPRGRRHQQHRQQHRRQACRS
jgi:hypothetical protein